MKIKGWTLEILTSLGGKPQIYEKLQKEKAFWLYQYMPDSVNYFSKINYVEHCHHKKEYARSNTFLLDDRSCLVNDFQIAGGMSYHYDIHRHKSSLRVLKNYL